jgi:hypothetical protein
LFGSVFIDVFQVHVAKAAISGMALMEKDAKDLHDELLAWLSGHPELTYSGRTSAVSCSSEFFEF